MLRYNLWAEAKRRVKFGALVNTGKQRQASIVSRNFLMVVMATGDPSSRVQNMQTTCLTNTHSCQHKKQNKNKHHCVAFTHPCLHSYKECFFPANQISIVFYFAWRRFFNRLYGSLEKFMIRASTCPEYICHPSTFYLSWILESSLKHGKPLSLGSGPPW